jgi:hypothetical protein
VAPLLQIWAAARQAMARRSSQNLGFILFFDIYWMKICGCGVSGALGIIIHWICKTDSLWEVFIGK